MRAKLAVFAWILSAIACGIPPAGLSPDTVSLPASQAPQPIPATPAPAVPSPALLSFHMLDERAGWGITETGVFRTDDGGLSWQDITPPGAAILAYGVASFFLDASHGWVLLVNQDNPMTAGTLYRTVNGGGTWDSIPVPFGGGRLVFLDASNGWMLADQGVAAGSNAVSVLQTTDGGSTWILNFVNDPTFPGATDSLPLSGLKNGLSPIDMQTAWIGGVTYAAGVVYLYRTSDGGHLWEQVPFRVPADQAQAQLDTDGPIFVGPRDAFLPIHVYSSNGTQLDLYASHDRGESWTRQSSLPNGGSLDFVSPNDGIFWDGAAFYVTHDGAANWQRIVPNVAFGENFADLDFVSPLLGWVLTNDVTGRRRLYVSTDGAANWSLLGE